MPRYFVVNVTQTEWAWLGDPLTWTHPFLIRAPEGWSIADTMRMCQEGQESVPANYDEVQLPDLHR